MNKIYTYLIHGSLGSGKTTLLKSLFTSNNIHNSIVIENEYANVNVDKNILSDCKVKIMDVSGGCICCTSGKEFFETLDSISTGNGINNLFIETTGVASSVSLIKQLMLSSQFDEHFELVKNIYVIDTLEDNFDDIIKKKLIDLLMADIVILTKVDLAKVTKVKRIVNFLNDNNLNYVISDKGRVNPNKIISKTQSRSIEVLRQHIDMILTNNFADHSSEILYQVLYPSKKISKRELKILINTIKNQVYRVKGQFTDEKGNKILVNATRNNIQFNKTTTSTNDTLVFIGHKLTKTSLKPIMEILC